MQVGVKHPASLGAFSWCVVLAVPQCRACGLLSAVPTGLPGQARGPARPGPCSVRCCCPSASVLRATDSGPLSRLPPSCAPLSYLPDPLPARSVLPSRVSALSPGPGRRNGPRAPGHRDPPAGRPARMGPADLPGQAVLPRRRGHGFACYAWDPATAAPAADVVRDRSAAGLPLPPVLSIYGAVSPASLARGWPRAAPLGQRPGGPGPAPGEAQAGLPQARRAALGAPSTGTSGGPWVCLRWAARTAPGRPPGSTRADSGGPRPVLRPGFRPAPRGGGAGQCPRPARRPSGPAAGPGPSRVSPVSCRFPAAGIMGRRRPPAAPPRYGLPPT
jgi:hypothetical protein